MEESGAFIPEIKMVYSCDFLYSHPMPFKCAIKPRSTKAVELIHDGLER